MKIIMCEDDTIQCGAVESILLSIAKKMDCSIVVEVYTNGKELQLALDNGISADIYLLDIEIGSINGMQIAEKIRGKDKWAYIVFITSHNEYMQEAFGVHAYHYLIISIAKLNSTPKWNLTLQTFMHNKMEFNLSELSFILSL